MLSFLRQFLKLKTFCANENARGREGGGIFVTRNPYFDSRKKVIVQFGSNPTSAIFRSLGVWWTIRDSRVVDKCALTNKKKCAPLLFIYLFFILLANDKDEIFFFFFGNSVFPKDLTREKLFSRFLDAMHLCTGRTVFFFFLRA